MNELLRYWYDVLKSDLEGFADRGSPIVIEEGPRKLVGSWVQRARPRREEFRLSPEDDFRWVRAAPSPMASYRDFLLSEQMADFGQLATAIVQAFPKSPNYVPTTAEVEEGPTGESDKVLKERVRSALEGANGETQLLFVKGEAGAGKTTLLKEIVADQAAKFQRGEAKFLFLLIDAQGRALSNLRDALAGELNDLRAGFTRDAVPALARRGVLVPIIDGFDELLGIAGYGDAFGSLQQFLAELDGNGVIVVSARSSFYDVEFIPKNAATDAPQGRYLLTPITLRSWTEPDFSRYLAKVRGNTQLSEQDRKAIAALSQNDRALLGKPFFASRFPEYLDAAASSDGPASLLQFLVDAYVRRESGKIVDKDGRPLVPVAGHKLLFDEAAGYMWSMENRRLNTQDLRFLAEFVADACNLSSDAAGQFVTKITSYAGFKTAERAGEREFAFEHEVYFDFFLGEVLRSRVDKKALSPSDLDRGVLPDPVVDSVVSDSQRATQCLAILKGFTAEGVLHENLRRNTGQLLAASFRTLGEVKDAAFGPASFVNVMFGNTTLKDVVFRRCNFIGTRLENARFESCRAEECQVERIRVSDETRLGLEGLVPGQNVTSVVDVTNQRELYSPNDITATLRRIGAPLPAPLGREPEYSAAGEAVLNLLHSVVRKYQRTNVLCLQDEFLARILHDNAWEPLRKLLVAHQIVGEETRPTSGTRKTFLRPLISLPTLMSLEKEPNLPLGNLGDFWRGMRAL